MTQRNDAFGLTYKPQLPPRHDYGIGIIGCGGIMNYAHLPAYRAHQLNIIGCYDVNPAAMHETAQRHAIATTYLDIAALLADPRIEIVDIAVPAWEQRSIAEQVLAAGKHILCQKPLAETLDDARAMAEEALALVRASSYRGAWVADLLRYGARIYRICQPHFLGEYLCEWLAADGLLSGNETLKQEMCHELMLARYDLELRVRQSPHLTDRVEREMATLLSLQVAETALAGKAVPQA